MKKKYTVKDVLAAGFNLEPLHCLFCGSREVVFHQYISDAYCENCGKWQLEEPEKKEAKNAE